MNIAIMTIIVMTIVGIIFGLVLAYGNKKFTVEVNPLIHLVDEALPKGQCGGCGFAGCQAYAEAVVLDPKVPPNLCVPGKEAVAKAVAELTGKAADPIEPAVAHLRCAGSKCKAVNNYDYDGVEDCIAANILLGGPKVCKYGCIGLGTCVKNCPFDAMVMGDEGLPIINLEKCTGCGKCESICPKKTIHMVQKDSPVRVNCNSKDKGAVARKQCTAACIGCGLCSKSCPHGAIKIENNLASVDTHICIEKCNNAECLTKCPTKAITSVIN